jgi:6-phosphogluconolactonase
MLHSLATCGLAAIVCTAASSGTALTESLAARDDKPEKLWVYIGTYTGKNSKGIYRSTLDLASGQLTNPVLAGEATNPSFLAIHPSRRFLYAVGEIGNFGGKKAGGVSAFSIDAATGNLTMLNQQSSYGADPCHIVLDKEGKHALVANYTGGSACAIEILPDGKLGDSTGFAQHAGSSVNKQRQQAPHAHSINLDASNRFAFVADLGLDQVVIYKFDKASGNLTMNDPRFVSTAPGAGPRHFAFHPNGKTAYVINELENTINVLAFNPERGELKSVQKISTLPSDFTGKSYTAEVQVHPSGKFVYGSNRGHNSIAIFAVDAQTGELKLVGHQAQNIKTPRNFAVDPTGRYLIVANQDGNSLIVFRINPETGELTPTGSTVECPAPVCVKMMPAGA